MRILYTCQIIRMCARMYHNRIEAMSEIERICNGVLRFFFVWDK